MCPQFSSLDARDTRLIDAEAPRDFALWASLHSDSADIFVGEFSLGVSHSARVAFRMLSNVATIAFCAASDLCHVTLIFLSRARRQVCRVAATSISDIARFIARVAEMHYAWLVVWNRAISQCVSESMRSPKYLANSLGSVSVFVERASPQPAFVVARCGHAAPEILEPSECVSLGSSHALTSNKGTGQGRWRVTSLPARFYFSTQGAFHAV